MVKVQNFNENLEKSLERIGQKITVRVEQTHISEPKEPIREKEIVKESIKTIAHEIAPPPELAAPGVPPHQDHASVLPVYLTTDEHTAEVKKQITKLVEIAVHESIEKSLAAARKTNPFIEDAFHDALVDVLLPELKKRGMLT